MRSAVTTLALAATLAACQGPASAPSLTTASAVRALHPNYEACGSLGFKPLDKSGGSQRVPHIAREKQFMGSLPYAAIDAPGSVLGLIFSCPNSVELAPVPQGYTADWFGSWTLYCKKDGDGDCTGLSFANGSLTGEIISNVWVPSQTYYLYVYTDDTRQYIESYEIGPVTKGAHGNYILSFPSPFENSLQYPTNDGFALEIVHPSGAQLPQSNPRATLIR